MVNRVINFAQDLNLNLSPERRTIAKILVDLNLDKAFDYIVPDRLLSEVLVGCHVRIPFGRGRVMTGCVVAITGGSDFPGLKEIESLCPTRPRIPEKLLGLAAWMAQYYCCSREQAIRALLPGAVRSGRVKEKFEARLHLADALKAGAFILESRVKSPARAKAAQELLANPGMTPSALARAAGVSPGVISALVESGMIVKEMTHTERDPLSGMEILRSEKPVMTDEQRVAVEQVVAMMSAQPKTQSAALLHGVTGSGKTEVYLRAIEACVESGRSAIALVPEIALTPQTTERFRGRFGDVVSVLHSGMSEGERFDEWSKVNSGRVKIVVGARSALFAPVREIGLIVVDEEHETSYKQDKAPRYNARDVAVMRAVREGAVALLGSATPSLESYRNAEAGKYRLLRLTKRIDGRVMPRMIVVDMRAERAAAGAARIFSQPLVDAVKGRLERGEQCILFLNRRGYATHLQCSACGFVAECPSCSIRLTYHKSKSILTCHICGLVERAPESCPACSVPGIKYSGVGTEKVEAAARGAFPMAKVDRMDSDTMTMAREYHRVLDDFKRGRIDILIGTQMIAKGLDFPNVTLVGVLNADLSLHMPDFRAEERTFQLLTQVAGRAGRGDAPGDVYIQTYTVFNPAINWSLTHDYVGFYKDEIEIRRQLLYPPEGRFMAIRFSGEDEAAVVAAAETVAAGLRGSASERLIISEPVPASVAKIKNRYRYCMTIRGAVDAGFRKLAAGLALRSKWPRGIDIQVDMDAVNLM